MKVDIYDDLSERVQYTNSELPFYCKRARLSQYENYRAVSHWHKDLEFIYIYSGSMQYYINGETVKFYAGEGIVVNSSAMHYGFSDSQEECDFVCFLMHPLLVSHEEVIARKFVLPLISETSQTYTVLHPDVLWQRNILEALKSLVEQENSHDYLMYILEKSYLIFRELHDHLRLEQTEPGTELRTLPSIKAMAGYIHGHYADKVSLDEIAQAGNVCKSNCIKLFQDYYHETPIIYMTKYRLKKSIEMMENTELSISEIGSRCGFNSSSYFADTFRKYYSENPNKFRKHLQEKKRRQAAESSSLRG